MLTVEYAKALPNIKFNAVEPGFTSTDLTGNGAGQTVAEGAEVVVRLATIGKDGPTGTFQENAGELAWYCRITAARGGGADLTPVRATGPWAHRRRVSSLSNP